MKWLNEHSTRQAYDSNPDKVMKICKGNLSAKSKYEKLANNKNIVLLSRSAIGKKCQTTFFHSIVGIPILPDDIHYVARAGMNIGSGIEIDPDSFFEETGLIHAPTILDLLKVTTVAEFKALPAATVGTAKRYLVTQSSPLPWPKLSNQATCR